MKILTSSFVTFIHMELECTVRTYVRSYMCIYTQHTIHESNVHINENERYKKSI